MLDPSLFPSDTLGTPEDGGAARRRRRAATPAEGINPEDQASAKGARQGAQKGGASRPSTTGSKSSPPLPGTPHAEDEKVRAAKVQAEFRARRSRGERLRRGHRGLVHDHHASLSACGLTPIPSEAGGNGRASLSCDAEGHAAVSGTMRCGSPWACPVCAPRVASLRAQVLRPQVADFLKAEGASAWLITLTLRHNRGDDLAVLLDALRDTWGKVTSGKAWQRRRDEGRIEFVRGYDVTWSDGAGWHPHIHVLLLLDAEHCDEAEEIAKWVRDRWMSILRRKGFDALVRGQDVQRCDDPEAAAAYAVTPAATYESLAMALKRSRGEGSGRTPFELLSRATQDAELPGVSVERARALWVEYVKACRGRRQTSTSQGLTLAADDVLLADEEDQQRRESVDVAWLGAKAVAELDRRRLTIPLLHAVEDVAREGMKAMREAARPLLELLEADCWGLMTPPKIPDAGAADRVGPDGIDIAVPW